MAQQFATGKTKSGADLDLSVGGPYIMVTIDEEDRKSWRTYLVPLESIADAVATLDVELMAKRGGVHNDADRAVNPTHH